jgi:hypothetical protein
MTAVVLECYGARVRLSAPSAAVESVLEEIAPFATPAAQRTADVSLDAVAAAGDTWVVRSDSVHVDDHDAFGPRHLVAVLVDRLHALFSEYARGVHFVHAGAFRLGQSLVIVPGRSGAGKSSLVAEALRHGAVYYSDDFAVIDPDGMVHPYPRRLGLRRPSGARNHLSASALGAEVATEPAGVDLVLSTSFVSAGTVWSPEPVTGSRAALPIIDNTVRARLDPPGVAHMAAAVARRATTLVGDRGEAHELIAALRNRSAPIPDAASN